MYELGWALNQISSRRALASACGMKLSDLLFIAYGLGNDNKFKKIKIKKRSGGNRIIYDPVIALKQVLRKINALLLQGYRPKHCVMGYVHKRSILHNARAHQKKHIIVNIDLKDFFGSIHFGRIRGVLEISPYNFPQEVAELIAHLCCRDGVLFQGSPASPIISNILAYSLDCDLMSFSKDNRLTYTRYVDDITISTNRRIIPREMAKKDDDGNWILSKNILKIVKSNGFEINENKVHISIGKTKKIVTGIQVGEKLNVRRIYLKKLRRLLALWKNHGYKAASSVFFSSDDARRYSPERDVKFFQVVRGRINYIQMVRGYGMDDSVLSMLLFNYRYLFNRDISQIRELHGDESPSSGVRDAEVIFNTSLDRDSLSKAVFVVRTSEIYGRQTGFYAQGTGFYLFKVGIVTCFHCVGRVIGGRPDYCERPNVFDPQTPLHAVTPRVVGTSPTNDNAIIREYFSDKDLRQRLCFLPGPSPVLGQQCLLVGYPDYQPGETLRVEPVTIVGRHLMEGFPVIEISGRIMGGNSGGPLLDSELRVVGYAWMGQNEKNLCISIEAINSIYGERRA